ncbi:MAG: uroporphyrinogen-III synthase [Pseudomonadota bacterium]
MQVLLTRPEDQSQRFALQLRRAHGPELGIVIAPLLEPELLDVEVDFSLYDAIVLTSQSGAIAFRHLNGPVGMRAYCVGTRTAEVARNAGTRPMSADGDLKALNALLRREAADEKLLHLSGAAIAGAVEGAERVVAYRQREVGLPDRVTELLSRPVELLVPLFSPRTAQLFERNLIAGVQAQLHVVCLSPAVAQPLDREGYASLRVCEAPNASSMLAQLSDLVGSLRA